MNRSIKFRGKRVDNGEWVYGNGYVKDYFNDNEFIAITGDPIFQHMDMIKVVSETVGQFTGLYDKNGTEIYEGDIVVIISENGVAEILWDNDMSMFIISFDTYCATFDNFYPREIEVIGNIHDNKELL